MRKSIVIAAVVIIAAILVALGFFGQNQGVQNVLGNTSGLMFIILLVGGFGALLWFAFGNSSWANILSGTSIADLKKAGGIYIGGPIMMGPNTRLNAEAGTPPLTDEQLSEALDEIDADTETETDETASNETEDAELVGETENG